MMKPMKCPLQNPMSLFKENRQRLVKNLSNYKGSVVVLQGGSPVSHYSTDVDYLFRQEPFFQWAFGVHEPDFFGTIEVSTGEAVLFMPRLPHEYGVFMGKIASPEEVKSKYEVERVCYVDELKEVLGRARPKSLLTLHGVNSDSGLTVKGAQFEGLDEFLVDNKELCHIMSECRTIKSEKEIEVLRHVSQVSVEAHKHVMLNLKPGMHEYQGESLFLHYVYFTAGCRYTAYTCICGSGDNGSILHYGHAAAPNDKVVQAGDMCLFDMGASYLGYASDITISFPISGRFTPTQTAIYNAVYNARNRVLKSMKAGVNWLDMHLLSMRTILVDLKSFGAVQGDIDRMMKDGVGGVFMPHGLGHLMGLDVHDVGGYLEGCPERPKESWSKCLRTARELQAGMVITVEPGCYFIDMLLDKAFQDPLLKDYLVPDVIKGLRGFGGVRIEDDVLVTQTGVEVLSSGLPRTISEIQDFMANRRI